MYVEQFESIFYNIHKSENKEVKRRFNNGVKLIGQLVEKYVEIINELTIGEVEVNKDVDYIIVLFARKICEQLDAILVLFSNACISQGYVILRELYETCTINIHFKKRYRR